MPENKGIYKNLTSYGDADFSRYLRRAFLASAGYDATDLERPIVGITNTSSDFNPCHRGASEMIDSVKRGVLEAGGLPFAFPTMSLHEILFHPTTMLFRNLMAIETEELIRAQPMDSVVLIGGCDKTVPAQLMAAASANVPAISLVAGPMMTGHYRGERLGACTDCRRMWAKYRAGELDDQEIAEIEGALCPTAGTCMVMGTASTMACVTEALGMMLPGGACPPANTGDRLRQAVATGRKAVDLAQRGPTPKEIMTREAFHNALTVLMAVSGSTNVIIHLTAIARRCGVELTLDDFHEVSRKTPLLVDCKPAGKGYLEDFYRAGGLPVLLKTLSPLLDLSTRGVAGKKLQELLEEVEPPAEWQTTVRTLDDPLGSVGALTTLFGTLAPDGAVIKSAAASPHLLKHKGPALVFESPEDVANRIDSPELEVSPDHVLVMRNAGPIAAGMPEAGAIPIPKKLAREGVKDMVRVSDARMSGTAYGTIVLHCAPEAAAAGPLAFVQDGDVIELDVEARTVDLCVELSELERRATSFSPPELPSRGYRAFHAQNVKQAPLGADLE